MQDPSVRKKLTRQTNTKLTQPIEEPNSATPTKRQNSLCLQLWKWQKRSPHPVRLRTTLGVSQVTFTVFLWGGGLAYLHDAPTGVKVDSDLSMKATLSPIVIRWHQTLASMTEQEKHEL